MTREASPVRSRSILSLTTRADALPKTMIIANAKLGLVSARLSSSATMLICKYDGQFE